jgi:hypothetical protein
VTVNHLVPSSSLGWAAIFICSLSLYYFAYLCILN